MIRLLCLSDSHLRVATPSCRIDRNFYDVQFQKLKQIEKLIRQLGVKFVYHGGDLFDSNDPSHRLVYDVMAFLNYSEARWVVTPGNHDMFGANTQTLPRSGLGILWQAGVIDLVTKPADHFIGDTIIRQIPYSVAMDESLYQFAPEFDKYHRIIVPHEMLVTHFVPYPHKLISDVKTNADVIICSHWHAQFNQRIGKTTFVNSGPLTRQTTFEAKIKPGVILLEIGQDKITTSIIHLKVESASAVIDTTKGVEDKNEGLAEQFLTTLKASALEGVDRQKLIRMVGFQNKFPQPVVDASLQRLTEVEKTMEVM